MADLDMAISNASIITLQVHGSTSTTVCEYRLVVYKCKQLSHWFNLQLVASLEVSHWMLKLVGIPLRMCGGHVIITKFA